MQANECDKSLRPASFLTDSAALNDPAGPYADSVRVFQGIPGIECTAGGSFYSVFYTGGPDEGPGNILLLQRGRVVDGTPVFGQPFMAVLPPDPAVRCFDPCLWVSPDGCLRLFFAQSEGYWDGRAGVWMSVCANPDDEAPVFSVPRRIANGIMMNKPLVTSSGDWLLPCALWCENFIHSPRTDLDDERFSNVYVSHDGGETFSLLSHTAYHCRRIDEHMLVEQRDGSIRMLIRASDGIGEAFSHDGGRTWSETRNSGLGGPDSRFFVRRLPSGRLLLVNHVDFTWRNNLTALLSDDDGVTWPHRLLLDERHSVSYPDAALSPDGFINIIYDWNRYDDKYIHLARITEEDILAGRLVTPGSALRLTVNHATGKK